MEQILTPFSINSTNVVISNQRKIHDSILRDSNFKKINELLIELGKCSSSNSSNEKTLKQLSEKLKNEFFDICGNLVEIFQAVNDYNNDLFETELKLRNNNDTIFGTILYSIYFPKISKKLAEDINKLPKNIKMYFLKLKACLYKHQDNFSLKFLTNKKTKIYYDFISINDNQCPLNFTPQITKQYEEKENKLKEIKNNELSRFNNNNLNKNNSNNNNNNYSNNNLSNNMNSISSINSNNNDNNNYFYKNFNNNNINYNSNYNYKSNINNNLYYNNNDNNNNMGNFINNNNKYNNNNYYNNSTNNSLYNNNMLMTMSSTKYQFSENMLIHSIIKDINLKKILINMDESKKNFGKFLFMKSSQRLYNIKSLDEMLHIINLNAPRIDIVGIITNVKIDTKFTSVDILSLADSNYVKLIHYPNTWKFEPVQRQVISIDAINLKLNKNFDIILENPNHNTTKILGILDENEFNVYKKFRISPKKEFNTLISLINPIIVRNIQKNLVIIKEFLKITSRYDNDELTGEENFRFFLRCIIDDGTYEGEAFMYDDIALSFLELTNEEIDEIKNITHQSKNLILFQKTNSINHFSKEQLETFIDRQYVFYSVPYSKIITKHFNDNNQIDNYFKNLESQNQLKNLIQLTTFINGDLYYEKNINTNQPDYIPKPLLKVIHFEKIEFDNYNNNSNNNNLGLSNIN